MGPFTRPFPFASKQTWFNFCLIFVSRIVTACTCYILRSMTTTSKNASTWLISLLGLTITIAAFRLAFVATTAYGNENKAGNPVKSKAILATQFLLDIDTVTSVIISCIPSIRSWSRNHTKGRPLINTEGAVCEDSTRSDSRRLDNEELSLEYLGEKLDTNIDQRRERSIAES